MKRKVVREEEEKIEQPWVTDYVRKEIKERRRLSRKHRNMQEVEDRVRIFNQYLEQKKKAQKVVYEELTKYENSQRAEIKKGGKKLWDYVNMLKGKGKREEEIQIYNEEGRKLSKKETEEQLENFWGKRIYKMHENKVREVWNEEERIKYERDQQTEWKKIYIIPDFQ